MAATRIVESNGRSKGLRRTFLQLDTQWLGASAARNPVVFTLPREYKNVKQIKIVSLIVPTPNIFDVFLASRYVDRSLPLTPYGSLDFSGIPETNCAVIFESAPTTIVSAPSRINENSFLTYPYNFNLSSTRIQLEDMVGGLVDVLTLGLTSVAPNDPDDGIITVSAATPFMLPFASYYNQYWDVLGFERKNTGFALLHRNTVRVSEAAIVYITRISAQDAIVWFDEPSGETIQMGDRVYISGYENVDVSFNQLTTPWIAYELNTAESATYDSAYVSGVGVAGMSVLRRVKIHIDISYGTLLADSQPAAGVIWRERLNRSVASTFETKYMYLQSVALTSPLTRGAVVYDEDVPSVASKILLNPSQVLNTRTLDFFGPGYQTTTSFGALYGTQIDAPIYYETPVVSLSSIDLSFVSSRNKTIQFRLDWSITLEIIEIVDEITDSAVDTRRGVVA